VYAFHRPVPFGIWPVSVASNVAAERATASAAVGRSSLVARSTDASSVDAVVSVSMLVSRVLGPSGPTAASDSEPGSAVYYGWHVFPETRILNNCSCLFERCGS
jgi:hypothetical protein